MTGQQYVRDIMSPPTQTIMADQALAAARQRMQGEMGLKSLIVVQNNRPVGMLRYNDITNESVSGAIVADVMVGDVPTVRQDETLADVSGVMSEYDIDRLAVVDAGGALVGELPRNALTHAETVGGEAATTIERLSDAQANADTPVYDVRKDMSVVSPEGSRIGKVKEVMADSLSGSLTHVIVRTGLLFGKDKSIPSDLVDRVEGDEVYLKVDKSEVDMLPDLNANE